MIDDIKQLLRNLQAAAKYDFDTRVLTHIIYTTINSNLNAIKEEIDVVFPQSEFYQNRVYKAAELLDIRTFIGSDNIRNKHDKAVPFMKRFFRDNSISVRLFGDLLNETNDDVNNHENSSSDDEYDPTLGNLLNQINQVKKRQMEEEGMTTFILLNKEYGWYTQSVINIYKETSTVVKNEMIKKDEEENNQNLGMEGYISKDWWLKDTTNVDLRKNMLKKVSAEASRRMLEKDPLQFWKDHCIKFPHLSILARKVLCISSASGSPERIHSTSADVITKKRSKLEANLGGELTLSRMRSRHTRIRRKNRSIKWSQLGVIPPIDALKDLGDWIYDPNNVYDSGSENEQEIDSDVDELNDDTNDNEDNEDNEDIEGHATNINNDNVGTNDNQNGENNDNVIDATIGNDVTFRRHRGTGLRVARRNRQLDDYNW